MDAVEEIKSRLDVADIVAEYLPIKPAGSGAFKALCPFHQEKTPSFYISRPRQSWHCFGCDQGGDIISFVEKMEGMDFRETLEFLAQKAGVALPKFDGEKASARKRLHGVNDLATKFFHSSLLERPEAEVARAYLRTRGVDDLTIDLFKLGYAFAGWSSLSEALIKQGVSVEELVQAGLAVKRPDGSGVYDRFRDRVMFPIADIHGNIVGFTGRILLDRSKEAKYVNTPETVLYRKSAVLYGLDKAKGEIRQKDLAIIVEGNMDVIASHQFSVANVVAASGTALTNEQLSLLKRFTHNLAIAFDQDVAGNAATIRGLDLARVQDFSIKIISLPPEAGKDPDEAIRKDPQIWKEAIERAVSIMEWIYRQAFRAHPSDQPEGKKWIAQSVLAEVQRIADPVERDFWIKKLSRDLDISEGALREAMGRSVKDKRYETRLPAGQARDKGEKAKNPARELEIHIFSLLLVRPALWVMAQDELRVQAADWGELDLSTLYNLLQTRYPWDQSQTATPGVRPEQAIRPPADLPPDETKLFNLLASLGEQQFASAELLTLQRELTQAIDRLRQFGKKRERERLAQEMKEAHVRGDHERGLELSKRFDDLR